MTQNFRDLTRRSFLQQSGLLAAGMAMGHSAVRKLIPPASSVLDVNALARFVDRLPIPKIATPEDTRANPDGSVAQIPYYRIAMRETAIAVHRDVKPTRMWCFGGSLPGPTFDMRRGQSILVEWENQLPAQHFLPIDHTVHGAESSKPDVRAVTHLHGAKAPADSDGYPEDWYVPGKSKTYFYPNQQDAAMLWYHDHTLGITRLNVYAGLIGVYILRDEIEDRLNLPKGEYEIPLVLCDRSFDRDGQLLYPVSPDPQAPWVPEVFGEGILVNGKLFPYLEVEPRKYRFRILNAANGRFFHLALSNGQGFHQIGTDLGLLPSPVPLTSLLIAPGERADLVLDFSKHRGDNIVLNNDASMVMQFRVGKSPVEDSTQMPTALRPVLRLAESSAVQTRTLTLGEADDRAGNPMTMLLNNTHWDMPITETPKLGSTEIWCLLNFTDDSHPIHLHLVRFQILDRRSFEPEAYYHGGKIQYIGDPIPPSANEAGWKDTVQAHPGMVTRIIAKFDGYPGRYVWHCHILEHEDNEMMRPYEVIP